MKTKNLTVSLDEDLLKAGKRYAKLMGTSINELFRDFLKKKVIGEISNQAAEDMLEALDDATASIKATDTTKRKKWNREDAYSG